MINRLKENAIKTAIGMVFILIFTGGILSYYNRYMMSKALTGKEQSEAVLKEIGLIDDNFRFMDISARGYALIRKNEFLFWKVSDAQKQSKQIFTHLDSLFKLQVFDNIEYERMKRAMTEYTNVFSKMVTHLQNNETSEYLTMLEHDYGKAFYIAYTPILTTITSFETQIIHEAQAQYEAAVARNRILQLLLFLAGLPTLSWIFYKLNHDERERKRLLLNLEKNNKQYVFDSGTEGEKDARLILETSIENLQQAAKFVGEISVGNYDVTWQGLAEENEKLNKSNLAGKLILMRDEMKRMKEEDERRIWTTQGLSELSDIIRLHQHNLNELSWEALTFLVKYLKSQQGGLFLLREESNGDMCLTLAACYAYERKKFMDKKIKIDEGLIGQAFLEGQSILLKQVPDKYINITSGLGYATPHCVLIIPLKHNEKVEAVIEMATFINYTPYQIAFLEKAGEHIASAIFAAEQNERNKIVMEQLQSQSEQLRSQEEELRQNIEELEATQESMKRKELYVNH